MKHCRWNLRLTLLLTIFLLPALSAAQVPITTYCPLPGQSGTCTMATPLLPLNPALQPKFMNELPVPVFFEPDKTTFPGFDYYEIAVQPVTHPGVAFPQPPPGSPAIPAGQQWVGLVDPVTLQPLYTPVWGYAQVTPAVPGFALRNVATWPSMSFKATKDTPVKVMWINNLPDQHLFCPQPLNSDVPCGIDRTLMGTLVNANQNLTWDANEVVNQYGGPMQPDNAVVIHLHGGEVPPDSDGMAELWIGNFATSAAYNGGAYSITPYNVIDQAGGNTGVLANILPHFTPPANSGIPATYPAGQNYDAGAVGVVYQPGQLMRPTGDRIMYNYPNVQEAATIWYHDHALGKTRVNVAAGPAGFYIVEDPALEASLLGTGALPAKGDCSIGGTLAGNCYDVPIAFQDRAFNADGSINFPSLLGQVNPAVVGWNPLTPGDLPLVHPQWLPEYFGDVPVINGVAWPKMTVEPRPYRFRVLGGSNARCWSLTLKPVTALTKPPIYVVANEQGFLPNAIYTNRLTFCPGERYEVVIDFSNFANQSIFVANDAGAPFPNGAVPRAGGLFAFMANVMQFQVTKTLNTAFPPVPYHDIVALPLGVNKPVPGKALVPVAPLVATAGLVPRELILNEVTDPLGIPVRVQIDGKPFEAPVTETPKRGTTEVWKFINTTVDAHPIHLHLVKFQVVNRQKFDNRAYTVAAGIPNLFLQPDFPLTKPPLAGYLIGKVRLPDAWERGWKDTVTAFPGEVTTVIAQWDGRWDDCAFGAAVDTDPVTGFGGKCKFPALAAGAPFYENVTSGPYVWHCHIVDHEDNEMMRPSLVMP